MQQVDEQYFYQLVLLCRSKELPANCRLPKNRLEELQCYKFLQAVRQEDLGLIDEMIHEGVPNIVDICEPKERYAFQGHFI